MASVLVGVVLALAVAVMLLPARRSEQLQTLIPADKPTKKQVKTAQNNGDLGLLLIEVATILRGGATPARAWARALEPRGITAGVAPDADGVPPALRALGELPLPAWLPSFMADRYKNQENVKNRVPLRWLCVGFGARAARIKATCAAIPGAIAACKLTAALGAPLAQVLETVAQGVAEAGRAESSRRLALSGPRATARLLACLPPLGLLLGISIGAHPERILLDAGLGTALGIAGISLMILGHYCTQRLVRAATAAATAVDEALVLDLAAAALAAGTSIPGTLLALGKALGEEECAVVGRCLLLGASWSAAWQAVQNDSWHRQRATLDQCLRPGWEDGANPAPLLAASAASLRANRQAQDRQAAERLAVRLVVPLGLCHLPAFVILGIVPVIASVGLDLLAA